MMPPLNILLPTSFPRKVSWMRRETYQGSVYLLFFSFGNSQVHCLRPVEFTVALPELSSGT